jgi:predicted MFS family arabinose efflux permease
LAVAWAGSNYFVIVSLQPVLFGSLTNDIHFSFGAASLVLSANMLGALVGNIGAYLFLSRTSARSLIVIGSIAMSALQLLAALLPLTVAILTVCMLGIGFGSGILGGASSATVAVMDRPAKVFGIVVASEIVSGAAAIFLAPHVVGALGLRGLLIGLALAAVLVLPMVPFFLEPTKQVAQISSRVGQIPVLNRRAIMLLCSLAIVYIANNATWAYLEIIAKKAGLVGGEVGAAISIGQLLSLGGAMAASLIGGNHLAGGIRAGLILLFLATGALAVSSGILSITVTVSGIMGALCFAVPLYLAVLALADSSGRLVAWGQIAIGVGLMLGPPAASIVVDFTSLRTMVIGSASVYMVSLALAALAFRLRPAYGFGAAHQSN